MRKVVVGAGSCIRETQGGEQVWVKIPKPSRYGLVSSTPCEMIIGDSG